MTPKGGAGRGQGRKPLSPAEPTLIRSLRMPASLWAKLERLGGAAWVRARIEKAKEKKND